MDRKRAAWFEALKNHIALCRTTRPLVDRSTLSLEEELQCQIIKDRLNTWLTDSKCILLREEVKIDNFKSPYYVFTSNQPGLVAAQEIFTESFPRIAYLYQDEFRDWQQPESVGSVQYYSHFWFAFGPLQPYLTRHATDGKWLLDNFTIGTEEAYWVYEEGQVSGPLCGNGKDELWKWNGVEFVFLSDFSFWIS